MRNTVQEEFFMKSQIKVFILRMMVVLFGMFGVAQFASFAIGECGFFQMIATAPLCFALAYEAYFGAERILRARRKRAICLRIAHNPQNASRVA